MKKIFMPLVSVMNKLPFNLKILLSVSILFILLIAPSYSGVRDFLYKEKLYNDQLLALSYTRTFQKIIAQIQLHRGLINGYLNGNDTFKPEILAGERKLKNSLLKLIDFDKEHLNILKRNKNFIDALSRLELVKFHALSGDISHAEVFTLHNEIILSLIRSLREIAQRTSFDISRQQSVVYIAHMLQDKLLLLQEYTGQIRGLTTGILAKNAVTDKQKEQLLTLYTLINTHKAALMDNTALNSMHNYLLIQKESLLVAHSLKQLLSIVNRHILLPSRIIPYDSKKFFEQATKAIENQTTLYQTLAQNYEERIRTARQNMYEKYLYLLVGFMLIVLSAFYIFGALYYSVTHSLKKLQTASRMIARGKTDITLRVDSRDEIGQALLAFNHMGRKLSENISFLHGYKMAIDETSIVSKTDTRGIITYVNKLFCEISGYSEKELLGYPHNIVRHPDMPKSLFADLWKTIKNGKIWKGIVKNRKKDGSYYIVDATVIPIFDANHQIHEYVAVRHDVTELEKSKEALKKQKTDLLTGLFNRNQLLEDLQQIQKPILFYLNIDAFGALNDFYGEKTGDKVLIALSKLLQNIADQSDARLYKTDSDGFILLVEEGKIHKENYARFMQAMIDFVESQPIRYNLNNFINITLSGSVVFYDTQSSYKKLLTYANEARKIAQKENKKFLLYTKEMRKEEDYANNIAWIKKIKEAITEDRIVTYFQPIIDTQNGQITKYESLVRLIDTDGKAISPFFFLSIAQKAKLYPQITRIVIDKAFAAFEKHPDLEFSLNLTVEDIDDTQTCRYLFDKLGRYPYPQNVIVEITENEEIKDYDKINQFIRQIKQHHAKVAIDDFGSGYANFSHILALKPDFIKIDGSLIKKIDTDEESKIITEAIIAFSRKLGSKTVVEFVHNEAVYRKIIEMGADFAQGFYLGEPQPHIVQEAQYLS